MSDELLKALKLVPVKELSPKELGELFLKLSMTGNLFEGGVYWKLCAHIKALNRTIRILGVIAGVIENCNGLNDNDMILLANKLVEVRKTEVFGGKEFVMNPEESPVGETQGGNAPTEPEAPSEEQAEPKEDQKETADTTDETTKQEVEEDQSEVSSGDAKCDAKEEDDPDRGQEPTDSGSGATEPTPLTAEQADATDGPKEKPAEGESSNT